MENPTRVPFHRLFETVLILVVSLKSSFTQCSRAQIAIESTEMNHDWNELNGRCGRTESVSFLLVS